MIKDLKKKSIKLQNLMQVLCNQLSLSEIVNQMNGVFNTENQATEM